MYYIRHVCYVVDFLTKKWFKALDTPIRDLSMSLEKIFSIFETRKTRSFTMLMLPYLNFDLPGSAQFFRSSKLLCLPFTFSNFNFLLKNYDIGKLWWCISLAKLNNIKAIFYKSYVTKPYFCLIWTLELVEMQ